ncbi:hypothetical protein, partial [Rathayibacter toxicus]
DTEQKTIPANSTPIGDGTFLAPNGDLYYLNASSPPYPNTKIIASNVLNASFDFTVGNSPRISYVVDPVCP